MNNLYIGAIRGRHEMPVDTYLLDKVDDPTDIEGIEKAVDESFSRILSGVETHDTCCFLYVTGLTSVTIAAIKWCLGHGVSVTAMHYDVLTGRYFPQGIS